MNRKILLVDDEQNLLDAMKRQLWKRFPIDTALGPEEGLKCIETKGPFAVIVSDLRMPVMDGIELLSRVKALSPDTVRIMLTGNADLQHAIKAVNEGNIYRFLTKPCTSEILGGVLEQGIEQHRLVTAEKELLEKTLKGIIKALTELLSLLNPEALGRSSRIKRMAGEIAEIFDPSGVWQIETAAMLSQLGCVILPEEIIKKLCLNQALSTDEITVFGMHPQIGSDLVSHIPRMERIAEIIACQDRYFDGSDNPQDLRREEGIPLGARILKVVLDFDILESQGIMKVDALRELKQRKGWYDPAVLNALERVLGLDEKYVAKDVTVSELKPGMILSDDISTVTGLLVISRGIEISPLMIERLKNFSGKVGKSGIQEPIRVLVPLHVAD